MSYTDVGWSPYFPLISGLVTEIGGIVAHGTSVRFCISVMLSTALIFNTMYIVYVIYIMMMIKILSKSNKNAENTVFYCVKN